MNPKVKKFFIILGVAFFPLLIMFLFILQVNILIESSLESNMIFIFLTSISLAGELIASVLIPITLFEKLKNTKVDIIELYKLTWSKFWSKKMLKKLGISKPDALMNYIENPEKWEKFIKLIIKEENGDEWLESAFASIRMGSKGLHDARYLDHAFINVPPPISLFRRIFEHFYKNSKVIKNYLGIEAPTGWGKSRLLLWLALAFHLKKRKVYYFPYPEKFLDGDFKDAILKLLKNKKIVIIIDDYHLFENDAKLDNFLIDVLEKAKMKNNVTILCQTKSARSEEGKKWPGRIENKDVLSISEYRKFWHGEWIESFIKWFKLLRNTNLKSYINEANLLDEEYLREAISPWVFVSLVVDIKKLIRNQLEINQNPLDFILFTIINWGFAISGERGLSIKEIHNGFSWVRNNINNEKWLEIAEYLEELYNHINQGNEEEFEKIILNKIKEWSKKPKDVNELRLLPSGLPILNIQAPVKAHHIFWWRGILEKIWEEIIEEYIKKKINLSSIKDFCELVIVHGTPVVDGKYLSKNDDINILANCSNIIKLNLYSFNIDNISLLSECKNLKYLDLSDTKVKDISTLSECKNLEELYLNETPIVDIRPLSNYHNLEYLGLRSTNVENILPLSECKKLKYLNLNSTKVKYISPLSECKNLESLYLDETKIKRISPLSKCKKLKSLNLNNTMIYCILALIECENLEELDLSGTNIKKISPLRECKNLKELNLDETPVMDIRPLSECKNLEELDLRSTNVEKILPLKECKNLEHLDLSLTNVEKILPLKECKNLEELYLNGTPIVDIRPLSNCHNLKLLNLSNTNVENISPLKECHNLKFLDLSNTKVKNISPLKECHNLEFLNLSNIKVKDITPIVDLGLSDLLADNVFMKFDIYKCL
ncbi:MAG: leucine-rich repeat domain-containing protein [Promethearchaeota archaeon]